MTDPAVEALLAERVEKHGEVPVSSGDVLRWSEAHRETSARHWPDRTADWVAPPLMVTSLVRPLEWRPDRPGPPAHRGSGLHEQLKAVLGYPLGIAVGYELELHGLLREGDRVDAVERIASVAEEEPTRLGPGRRWVVENRCTVAGTDELVAIERFTMLGYDPARAPHHPTEPRPDPSEARPDPTEAGSDRSGSRNDQNQLRVEELEVTAVVIAMGASANRVWTPAHLDRDAARAAGVRDVFVDTSTQVGLLSGVACRAAGDDARPGRVVLRMWAPICPGDRLCMEARVADEQVDDVGVRWRSVDVRALVGGAVHSTLTARVAVAGPDGAVPWSLGADRWHP